MIRPPDFSERISALLSHPGESRESLRHSLDTMEVLLEETSAISRE